MSRTPMQFTFIFLGKTKKAYLSEGIEDFVQRLGYFSSVSIKIIKEKSFSSKMPLSQILEEEAQQILGLLSSNEYIVALDSKGRQHSSEDLAGLLTAWQESGRHQVVIIIGGAAGLSEKIRKRADVVLSLSKMTFTHDMARLIILEQLYRAFTILAGTGYHK